jgi:hypothetical protein
MNWLNGQELWTKGVGWCQTMDLSIAKLKLNLTPRILN